MITLCRIAQAFAVLVVAFFVAMISTIDLVAFQQAEFVAGAVTWLAVFAILVVAEKQSMNRLAISTVRED